MNYKQQIQKSELPKNLSEKIGGTDDLFSNDTLELILNSSMKASLEAEEIKNKFPLLVWSSRYETVEYQSIFSEYLASHGYVIAFVEDIPNSPYPWQIQTVAEKETILNQHISDLNAAIGFLKQRENIDSTKIGLLAWSYAGESAILTQMNNTDIDLVIGLSGLGFESGVYLGQDLSVKIDTNKITVPYLILSEQIGTNGKVRKAPQVFNSMHAQSRYISFNELSHGNFNAIEGMIPGILKTDKVQSWSRGGSVAQLGYETICQISILYLRSIFNNTESGDLDEEILKITENLPHEFITVSSPDK